MMLSKEEAYKAMFLFLQKWYEIGNKEEEQIANMLSAMQLHSENQSADPAVITDWDDCVKEIIKLRDKKELSSTPWMIE